MGMGMGGVQGGEPGGVNQALYETQPGENGEVGLQREQELAEEGSSGEEEVGDVMAMAIAMAVGPSIRSDPIQTQKIEGGGRESSVYLLFKPVFLLYSLCLCLSCRRT